MADYKHTINLPQTGFAMKANLAQREPEMLARWDAIDVYRRIREACAGRPGWFMLDGPPYANGAIHLGHCVNKVLKDMIVKSRTLSGCDAPYVPGWDCHGLPIELQVEKKHGKVGQKLDARAFRQACREFAMSQVDSQREDFRRLGVLGDWDNPYLTLRPAYEAAQLRAFARIIERGHLYKGYKPVHWCLDCRSALAEAEVEYADKRSTAVDVRFRALEPGAVAAAFGADDEDALPASVPIWTTTAWTLPANQAVALGETLDYVLVRADLGAGDELLVLAEALAEAAMARYGAGDWRVLGRTTGAALTGLRLAHPFFERDVPVVPGEHVSTETGTGAVHIAPGHGHEDFALGVAHGLPLDNPVTGDGVYTADTPMLAGRHINKAGAELVEMMRESGVLLHSGPFEHSYPHCWRHKSPLIFRATPQWFVSLDRKGLRDGALAAIERVGWTPDWGQQRIEGMIRGRPDWCISRQRTWGVPVALFAHRETGEPHPDSPALLERVAERVAEHGIDAWFDLDPAELLGDEAAEYEKVTDTMDVWFDSGVAHHCVPSARTELPQVADLYLEGSDQHRGWFQSSLLTSVAMHGRAPYRNVLTHGFTVDEKGHKLSKSSGTAASPQKVFRTLGADILRLWVAATDYRYEMHVSDEILKRTSDAYRRLRNTARFLLGNLAGFDPARDRLGVDELVELDAWAINRARELQAEVVAAYEAFEFHHIYQKVHNFCVVDMGGFYLDVIKDRLYTTPADGHARRSAQTAMHHIAEAMVRWLAPMTSFTAEEIWQHLPGEREESVFLTTWHELPDVPAARLSLPWDALLATREAVAGELERLRRAGELGGALEAEVTVYADGRLLEALQRVGEELRFLLLSSDAGAAPLADADAADAGEAVRLATGERVRLSVRATAHAKCVRCWQRRDDVGAHEAHPELCGRCVNNVDGPGESRAWA